MIKASTPRKMCSVALLSALLMPFPAFCQAISPPPVVSPVQHTVMTSTSPSHSAIAATATAAPAGTTATSSGVLDLTSTQATLHMTAQHSPISILVGNCLLHVTPTTSLTAAELVAASQVAAVGAQSLVINANGAAVGGTFNLAAPLALNDTGLIVPHGVTAIDNAAQTAAINFSGNLVNYGTIFAGAPHASTTLTASINANNIFNQQGGLITSVLPSNYSQLGLTNFGSILNLSLTAMHALTNLGSIMSSGSLSVTAGDAITNGAAAGAAASATAQTAAMQAANNITITTPQLANYANINSQLADLQVVTNTIQNAGTMQSLLGNISVSNLSGNQLLLEGNGGISAAQNINVLVSGGTQTNHALFYMNGGTLTGSHINLTSPDGIVAVSADRINGPLDLSACSAGVGVAAGDLTIEKTALSGDPLFYNASGDIDLSGLWASGGNAFKTNGGDFVALASGNIIATSAPSGATIDTTQSFGTSGKVDLEAGVTFTQSNGVNLLGTLGIITSSLLGSASPTFSYTVTGASSTGGNINLSGVSFNAPGATFTANADAGSAAAGAVNVGAINASNVTITAATHGAAIMNGTSNIDISGNIASSGNVSMNVGSGAMAGGITSSGTIGATGDVQLKTTSMGNISVLNNISSGSTVTASTSNGNIQLGSVTASTATVLQATHGTLSATNVSSPSLTAQSDGDLTITATNATTVSLTSNSGAVNATDSAPTTITINNLSGSGATYFLASNSSIAFGSGSSISGNTVTVNANSSGSNISFAGATMSGTMMATLSADQSISTGGLTFGSAPSMLQITSKSANITVASPIDAGQTTLTANSTNGTISGAGLVTSGYLNASSGSGGTALTTTASNLNLSSTGATNISDTNGGTIDVQAASNSGALTVTATNGNISTTSAIAGSSITLDAQAGRVTLGTALNAGNSISVTAAGDIIGTSSISAPTVQLTSASGGLSLGTLSGVTTATLQANHSISLMGASATTFSATSTIGDIAVSMASIGSLKAIASSGSVNVNANGNITVLQGTAGSTSGKSFTLTNNGSITVHSGSTITGAAATISTPSLSNSGLIDATAGNLSISSASGSLQISNAGTLQASGSVGLNGSPGVAVSGAGTLSAGATLDASSANGNVSISQGTITGAVDGSAAGRYSVTTTASNLTVGSISSSASSVSLSAGQSFATNSGAVISAASNVSISGTDITLGTSSSVTGGQLASGDNPSSTSVADYTTAGIVTPGLVSLSASTGNISVNSSSLRSTGADLSITSFGATSLSNSSLFAQGGNVLVNAGTSATLSNSSLTGVARIYSTAGGTVTPSSFEGGGVAVYSGSSTTNLSNVIATDTAARMSGAYSYIDPANAITGLTPSLSNNGYLNLKIQGAGTIGGSGVTLNANGGVIDIDPPTSITLTGVTVTGVQPLLGITVAAALTPPPVAIAPIGAAAIGAITTTSVPLLTAAAGMPTPAVSLGTAAVTAASVAVATIAGTSTSASPPTITSTDSARATGVNQTSSTSSAVGSSNTPGVTQPSQRLAVDTLKMEFPRDGVQAQYVVASDCQQLLLRSDSGWTGCETKLVAAGGSILEKGDEAPASNGSGGLESLTLGLSVGKMVVVAGAKRGVKVKVAQGEVDIPAGVVGVVERRGNGTRIAVISGGNAKLAVHGAANGTISATPGQEIVIGDDADEELIAADGVDHQTVEARVLIAEASDVSGTVAAATARRSSANIATTGTTNTLVASRRKKYKLEVRTFDQEQLKGRERLLACLNCAQANCDKKPCQQDANPADKPAEKAHVVPRRTTSSEMQQTDHLRPVGFTAPAAPNAAQLVSLQSLETKSASVKHSGRAAIQFEKDNIIRSAAGEIVVTAHERTTVKTNKHTITIEPHTIAMVTTNGNTTIVRNLYESREGSIALGVDNKNLRLDAGQECVIGTPDTVPSKILRTETVARRNVRNMQVRSENLMISDVSLSSILSSTKLFALVFRSADSQDRQMVDKMLKMAAIIGIVTGYRGRYSTMKNQQSD